MTTTDEDRMPSAITFEVIGKPDSKVTYRGDKAAKVFRDMRANGGYRIEWFGGVLRDGDEYRIEVFGLDGS